MTKLKEFTTYKYVRLSTDELRFTKALPNGKQHKELVGEEEVAVSAGLILVLMTTFNVIDTGSVSLKINGSLDDDVILIEKETKMMFNKRCT
jgi:hypothetical protein